MVLVTSFQNTRSAYKFRVTREFSSRHSAAGGKEPFSPDVGMGMDALCLPEFFCDAPTHGGNLTPDLRSRLRPAALAGALAFPLPRCTKAEAVASTGSHGFEPQPDRTPFVAMATRGFA